MRAAQFQLAFVPAPGDVPPVGEPALAAFHPVVQRWFQQKLGSPSEPQVQGWPVIREGHDVLIAAPTGSGKTLTAFLACLDELVRRALLGTLEDSTRVLYVSPLKALGNDVQKNLLGPLAEILELARQEGHSPQDIRVGVRTGDTKASERTAHRKRPPHVLITTPESLYLCLTARGTRERLRGVETVIVDEIHALARDKRGSHLALSLERLAALTRVPPQRIGLSATQKPLSLVANFLTGGRPCALVQVGHLRPWELRIEIPRHEELGAVATHEMWGEVYDRLQQLSAEYRTLLVFTNTRRLAERLAHDLGERMGQDAVAAHHGSMSRELRLRAEERLKAGELRVMVATASLELGIDIGNVDLVVQLGTPRSISVALQRVGRAGHHKGGTSRGLFFCLTRDDLVECTALLRAIKEGELDAIRMPEAPLDILAQQLVAWCACEDQDEEALYAQVKRAWPYRELSRKAYEQLLVLLSEGVATSRGRARVHLHRDRVNGKLRARQGARLTALMNGGAIPDTFTYPVIAEPEGKQVGALDEDFAIDSSAGDIFVLGSTSWRILRVEAGTVRVEDAHGAPPNVPFWRGEAPGRTDELSSAVGRLRQEVMARADAQAWLEQAVGLPPEAAELLVRYLQASASVLGAMPAHDTVVAERFFDEAGGMQLVLHAPFGSRINRAWGLALRKRFCRSFDFELQAAATDDGVLLSLSEQHSFPLLDIFDFVTPEACEEVLVQAVLQTPLYGTRFRWNAQRALALERMRNGKRVPPQIQRSRGEDLLAAVFPAQLGCQDNHGGVDVELPDHPLVQDAMHDCLHDALDVEGLRRLVQGIREKRVRVHAVDTPEPSPLSHQLLNSAPYTFLDEAPLEERRARAVSLRRSLPAADQAAFGALDAEAIRQVVVDARPVVRSPDELHDALLQLVAVPFEEVHPDHRELLIASGRAAVLDVPASGNAGYGAGPLRVESAEGPGLEVKAEVSRAAWGTPVNDGGRRWEFLAVPVDSFKIWTKLQDAPVRGSASLPPPSPLPTTPEVPRPAGRFVVAAERVPHVQALWPDGVLSPALSPLPGDGPVTLEAAAAQAVRGWMEQVGPCTVAELSGWLRLRTSTVDEALHALENEGSVLRGTFRPERPPGKMEWCDRRLLQRIHRLTVGRLRKEIEPLSAQDAMRFWFRWHHLEPGDALKGTGGLLKAVSLLEGVEAPASTWESALLPARVAPYAPEVLEQLSWRGEVAWGRLGAGSSRAAMGPRRGAGITPAEAAPEVEAPAARRATLTRNAPISFVRRESLDWMLALARPGAVLADGGARLPEGLSDRAREVADALERRGASFSRELCARLRCTPPELDEALRELLAHGVVTADAVENLRALLSPARRRAQKERGGGAGRWSLLLPLEAVPAEVQLHSLAGLLLRRYGILCRDVAVREPLVDSWRELLRVLRRMEARGEVRGGRFIAGVAGEQFALPEAVDLARALRRSPGNGVRVRLSACDPLNLTGVVTPGPRVASVPGRFVVYVDGIPVPEDAPSSDDMEVGEEEDAGETAGV